MLQQIFRQAAHPSVPDMHTFKSWLLIGIHTGKALVKENPFKMLFIAYSPGSRLPASRGRADFRRVERRKPTRMGHDSSPGWAVFSRFKSLGSCQALFWELNSTRLRPRQERSASCSAPDQTSAGMSAGTAKAPTNRSSPSWAWAEWVSINKEGGNQLVI